MTEIEKLFENAGIKKAPDINNCYPEMMKCYHCEHYKVINEYTGRCLNEVYPDFTAEKQLKIIEWFISCSWWLNLKSLDKKLDFSLSFDEKLAKLVNRLWESFDNQEKEEIRGILNE